MKPLILACTAIIVIVLVLLSVLLIIDLLETGLPKPGPSGEGETVSENQTDPAAETSESGGTSENADLTTETSAAPEQTTQESSSDEGLYDWEGGIPQFFQDDYPDDLYGSGTIAKNGCSITCLAMVATAMTGHTFLPDELAYYFGGLAENNVQRLEIGSEALQLSYRRAKNADQVWPALEEGKIVIVLMNQKSIFTTSQHFIVLTGLNENGKILVNDPNRDNYSHYRLVKGFEEGFERLDIVRGYSGAWIYDPEGMPEKPFIYSEPKLDMTRENYPGITLTDGERKMIASLIWIEARGESAEGQQAVAEVVLNRISSDRFPNSVRGVIYGEGQFPAVELGLLEDAEPWQAQYQAIDRALHGDLVLEKDVFFYARTALNSNIFRVIGNHVFCYG